MSIVGVIVVVVVVVVGVMIIVVVGVVLVVGVIVVVVGVVVVIVIGVAVGVVDSTSSRAARRFGENGAINAWKAATMDEMTILLLILLLIIFFGCECKGMNKILLDCVCCCGAQPPLLLYPMSYLGFFHPISVTGGSKWNPVILPNQY